MNNLQSHEKDGSSDCGQYNGMIHNVSFCGGIVKRRQRSHEIFSKEERYKIVLPFLEMRDQNDGSEKWAKMCDYFSEKEDLKC
jgi:hypothetical protein